MMKVGKSYRWVGPVRPFGMGLPTELSRIWEKGEPHKLLKQNGNRLVFQGIYEDGWEEDMGWAYKGFESNFKIVRSLKKK